MKGALPALLAAVLWAAGCIEIVEPPLGLAATTGGEFSKYTWPEPFVTDGKGNLLPNHAFARDSDLPRFVPRLLPESGGEPNIGITSIGGVFVTSGDMLFRSQDKGGTWKQVWDFQVPGWPLVADRFSTSDPMLWVDSDEDRVFASHMHPGTFCTYLAYSDDEGETWTDDLVPAAPGLQACTIPWNDHQKLMTARYGPQSKTPSIPTPDLRAAPWSKMLHMCYAKFSPVIPPHSPDLVSGTWCTASYNSGATWTQDVQVWPRDKCAPQNGHPAAHPDGTIFLPRSGGFACRREPRIAISEDNGVSWRTEEWQGTKIGQSEMDPDVTITPDGTAYMLFRGGIGLAEQETPGPGTESPASQLTHLFRSRDKFRTWEGPWRVSPPNHVMDVFAVVGSGDNGRIAMAYLGTTSPQPPSPDVKEPSFTVGGTIWHLFVTYSLDADSESPTFVTQQVTPNEDPIQVGCVWLRGGSGGPMMCRNLLDFIDMDVDEDGRVYVALTDGCVPRNGCTADLWAAAGQSHDAEIAVAVQTKGWSLFADKRLEELPWEFPQPMPETGQAKSVRDLG